MRWFWRIYAPGVSGADFDAAPLRHPNLPPLPPTLVTTAQYDVLRDEAIVYAHKLQAAGVTSRTSTPPTCTMTSPWAAARSRAPAMRGDAEGHRGWLKAALG